jgi:hypothetical protein
MWRDWRNPPRERLYGPVKGELSGHAGTIFNALYDAKGELSREEIGERGIDRIGEVFE